MISKLVIYIDIKYLHLKRVYKRKREARKVSKRKEIINILPKMHYYWPAITSPEKEKRTRKKRARGTKV